MTFPAATQYRTNVQRTMRGRNRQSPQHRSFHSLCQPECGEVLILGTAKDRPPPLHPSAGVLIKNLAPHIGAKHVMPLEAGVTATAFQKVREHRQGVHPNTLLSVFEWTKEHNPLARAIMRLSCGIRRGRLVSKIRSAIGVYQSQTKVKKWPS